MLSLTSRWYIKAGQETSALRALDQLARDVRAGEPDTLAYLVHVGREGDEDLVSLPSARPGEVTFFEIYRDHQAFLAHVGGPAFTGFLKNHGDLFLQTGGNAFHSVSFLDRHAGFIRPAAGAVTDSATCAETAAPGVMCEIVARDQARMKEFYAAAFDWQYETGGSGFAYVQYPADVQPRLSGIGQAAGKIPGFDPGNHFYLQVDDLDAAIARAVTAGGQKFVPPTEVDGYHFAMIRDPEGNVVGLIRPF